MTTVSASEAKTHFGVLMDKAQKGPVTIEKKGRPVAVVISFEEYQEQYGQAPSADEKKQALSFLKTWGTQPAAIKGQDTLQGDIKAQAIWGKYTQQG